MANLLTCDNLSKSFSDRPLFENVSFGIEGDERLGLIGPNGSGKSTLLKILAGIEQPDTGAIIARKNLQVAYLPQNDDLPMDLSVHQIVADALIESVHDEHARETQAAIALGKIGFTDFDVTPHTLSGGWRKRLAIARALVLDPDLLLLDEPTNHLDLDSIDWLEGFLKSANFALVLITHDRYFLQNVTKRTLELDQAYPDGMLLVDGAFTEFLKRRADWLEAQEQQQRALASKVREDLKWLSRGPQGRTTKRKSRIDAAANRQGQLAELKHRNAPRQSADIDFNATGRQTHKLLMATNISKTLGDKTLFQKLDVMLSPGSCLGLVGPNGSGKSTLLKTLTGELSSDTGTIKTATDLRVVQFTQHREALDPTQTLQHALCPVSDTVFYRGKPLHVTAWAKKFLFNKQQFNRSVGDLSGGEQSRILIAKLMLEPADLLILDEPTNDLDIPSLEILEDSLTDFPGAVVLVTHDRFMLDRLATQVLSLDGRGHTHWHADYEQYQAYRAQAAPPEAKPATASAATTEAAPKPANRSRKLSYKDQREFDGLEDRIMAAEQRAEAIKGQMDDPAILANHEKLAEVCKVYETVQKEIETLYHRWEELDAMQC